MKRKNLSALVLALIFCAAMLSGCGGAEKANGAAMDQAAMANGEYGWTDDYEYDDGLLYEAAIETPAEVAAPQEVPEPNAPEAERTENQSGEKIIKNGNLSVETLEFDTFIRELEASVTAHGGYIESSSVRGSKNYRSADYTIRVPSEKYDSFMSAVGDLGTIVSQNESSENVTLKYIDIEARLNAYKAERESFMKLMEQAETVDEILQIQSYLTDVNYQIESYTSQLNSLKNKVSYSTVTVYVNEVARITPEAPKTVWERISTGFSESVYNVTEGLKSFFVGAVVSVPYLLIYGVIIAVIVVVIVVIIKASKRSQAKKLEKFRREQSEKENGEK